MKPTQDDQDTCSEELMQGMTELDKPTKMAETVLAIFDKSYALGWNAGFHRGIDWGRSGYSRWWWLPTIVMVMLLGTAFGALMMWVVLAEGLLVNLRAP